MFAGATVQQVEECVRLNDKQRMSLSVIDCELHIRANQGHTVCGISDEELLTPIDESEAKGGLVGVHGTTHSALALIMGRGDGGLSRMARNHVHLAPIGKYDDCATGFSGERGVVSGMRKSSAVVIHVDIGRAMLEGGLNFFRSTNGVLLTPDNILTKYFIKVVDAKTGETLFEREVPTGADPSSTLCGGAAGTPTSAATTETAARPGAARSVKKASSNKAAAKVASAAAAPPRLQDELEEAVFGNAGNAFADGHVDTDSDSTEEA